MPNSNSTIVVSGPPRSGTSLLMQMLVAARIDAITDGQRTEDDDNPRGYFEHDSIKRLAQDNSLFQNSAGKAVKVIHALLKYIPTEVPIAVIFLQRDLDEVLASQSVMLERLGRPQPKLNPVRMRELLESQLAVARKALDDRPDTLVLDIQYPQLIADPAGTAQRLAMFLELVLGKPFDAESMAACVDASLYRQRK